MKRLLSLRFSALMAVLCVCLTAFAAYGENNLAPIAAPRLFIAKGASDAKGTFSCVNYGSKAVSSFHYKASIDGKVVEEKDVRLAEPIKPGESGKLHVAIPTQNKLGDTQLVCEVSHVNGKYNESTVTISTLDITVLTKVPVKRVVFEDYTATWCQYCPRATAVMEYLAKHHPDDFIGIAIHQGRDPMTVFGYKPPVKGKFGLPYVLAARDNKVAGFTGEDYYQAVKQLGALMDVDVKAQWNASGSAVNVQSTTTFRTNLSDAKYALAYVLQEDSMHNASWAQANSFHGVEGLLGENEFLDLFIKSPSYVYGLKFNHVARSFLGIEDGLQGSLPKKAVADQAIEHKTVFKGARQQWTMQNKNNLHVVALVIDNATHHIVNAARCHIEPHNTTAIAPIKAVGERTEVARFNLRGQRLSAPEVGINIVKYSDGSVEKVCVRP